MIAASVALAFLACRRASGPIPGGVDLGDLADLGNPEGYSRQTLYGYMNGGAEIFLEYGFERLAVRRYRADERERTVELFEMRDPQAAAAIYCYTRRIGTERELAPGCRGIVTSYEVRFNRGRDYVVCRGDDPMVDDSSGLIDLCSRLVARLPGACGTNQLFATLPTGGRVAESEVYLAGPVSLNIRSWLARLGREGFQRGWLAVYKTEAAPVEAFLAEYSGPSLAMLAVRDIGSQEAAHLAWRAKGNRIALANSDDAPSQDLSSVCERLVESN
jgi:hypothetical protein